MEKVKRLLALVGMPVLYCALGYLVVVGLALPVRQVYADAIERFVSSFEMPTILAASVTYDPEALKPKPKVEAPAPQPAPTPEPPKVTEVSKSSVPESIEGNQVGRVYCERIGLDAPVMWGDSEYEYAYGAGQDMASSLPGFGRLVLLSGHNTTFFAPLEFIDRGDVIHFDTAYDKYEYTVSRIEVYMEEELSELINREDIDAREQLIMYTCYPFHPVESRRTDRLTVFAERTRGANVR